jgi:hypothetical protein
MEYGQREGKVVLCVIKHHNRRVHGKMEVYIHGFLTSAINGVPQLLLLPEKHSPLIATAHESPFGSRGAEYLACAES